MNPLAKYQQYRTISSRDINHLTNFLGRLFARNALYSKLRRANCIKFGKDIDPSSTLPMHVIDFRFLCFISNPERLRDYCGRKLRPHFGLFDPCKIREKMGKMPESILFSLGPLTYDTFWRGADRPSEILGRIVRCCQKGQHQNQSINL